MRGSPSFGSNYERCSQTRKISIGIMADSGFKANTGAMKEKVVPDVRETNLSKEASIEGNRDWQGLSASISGKQAEAAPKIIVISPSPTAETVHHANQTGFPGNSGVNNKVNEENDLPKEHPSQMVCNETVTLPAGEARQKNVVRVTYKRRKGVNGTAERVEGFSFATAQECYAGDKGGIEDKPIKPEIRTSGDLRKKLLETLGIFSSPHKEYSTSHSLDMNVKRSKLEKVCHTKNESVVQSKQNSDTTEPDLEDPDLSIRRAVTHSLTRKRDPATVQQRKLGTGPYSHKQNEQGNDIFNFQEGLCGSQPATKNERRGYKIEPHKSSFLDTYTSEKNLQVPIQKKPVSTKKTSSLGSRMRRSPSLLLQDDQRYVKPINVTLKNVLGKDLVREDHSPPLPETVDLHYDNRNTSFNNVLNQHDDVRDPTFGSKSPPTARTSPSSPPKVDQIFTSAKICSFKTWQIPTPELSISKASTESSDDEMDAENNHTGVSTMKDKDKRGLSKVPSLQKRDSPSSEDESPNNDAFNGTVEGNQNCKPLELNQDDGMSRAVTLFVLALEKLQNKMKSFTMKKYSEILMSTADKISSQLQNAESQIQADVGKLTSFRKSNKNLETRFHEQRYKLKAIYEKFIEEMNQHMQDCSRTFEKIEANKIELKGNIEKQKTSRCKLLLQVEKAIESQLNEAERRISGVHELASERMLQLKQVIAECMMEGVFD